MSEVVDLEGTWLDRARIEELLPHRGEILFLQGIRVHTDRHFTGTGRWEVDQMGLRGHFPQLSVVPAVFLVEAVAQVAGAGVFATRKPRQYATPHIGVLMSIRKCVFRLPVPVGTDVTLEVRTRQIGDRIVLAEATAVTPRGSAASISVLLGEVPVDGISAFNGGEE